MTVEEYLKLSPAELLERGSFVCEHCGREHVGGTHKVIVEKDAIGRLPEIVRELGAQRPFLLSGQATYAAAGEKTEQALRDAGIAFSEYVFPHSPVLPTEQAVGSAVMHFDNRCDLVIGIGSGVINDIGKLLARAVRAPYVIVGTAPSMDGFASGTSSMEMDGLKVSLNSSYAYAVIGDLDILCQAPAHMLASGVGDMIAKYISLLEWNISRIINNEYYCPVIAGLVEKAVNKIVSSADGLVRRDPEAVKAVMDGLTLGGIGMNYAKVSRPASGMEHYFSHIWDMRSLAFPGCRSDLHGIQCGIGTLYSVKLYEYLRTVTPDEAKARRAFADFSVEAWNRELRGFIGPGAETMIANEKKEGKYVAANFERRLNAILQSWDKITAEMEKLPSSESIRALLVKIGAPTEPSYLGYTPEQVKTTFTMTKDIRDKYIGSTLCFDLGLLQEAAEAIV